VHGPGAYRASATDQERAPKRKFNKWNPDRDEEVFKPMKGSQTKARTTERKRYGNRTADAKKNKGRTQNRGRAALSKQRAGGRGAARGGKKSRR